MAAGGAANILIGASKAAGAAAAAAAALATCGTSLAATVYLAIGASGNIVAGSAQLAGAISGDVKGGQKGADAAAVATTISGVATLIGTGEVEKAAGASAIEGVITMKVSEATKGPAVQRAITAVDATITVKDAVKATIQDVKEGAKKNAL